MHSMHMRPALSAASLMLLLSVGRRDALLPVACGGASVSRAAQGTPGVWLSASELVILLGDHQGQQATAATE